MSITNDQLEAAFESAMQEWLRVNPRDIAMPRMARFFFFAGSQFGCEVTADIYHRTCGPDGVPNDEVDGVPV